MRRLVLPLVVFAATALLAPAALADEGSAGAQAAAAAPAAGDFNGDGFSDLAVGAPGDDTAETDAGAVNVIRGGANGLTANGNQLWTLDTPGVPGAADRNDRFGSALAVGDFDRDGFGDLAIGAPHDDVGSVDEAGAVVVLYGSSRGLTTNRVQRWSLETPGVLGDAARGDNFGTSVATGDFDADGFSDLAVGVPRRQVGRAFAAGSVTVLFGSGKGLSGAGDQIFQQNTPGIEGHAATFELFGQALAAGNFGKFEADDLAVAAPLDEAAENESAGTVTVLYGSRDGLSAATSQRWTQARVNDRPESGDLFGWALAAADLGKDPHADLVVGVPGEDLATAVDAGAVNIIYGGASGLTATGNQFRSQNSNHVRGRAEGSDAFGSSLAAANFGRGEPGDVAIGVPGEDLQDTFGTGAVNVLYGTRRGIRPTGNQLWTRDSTGLVGDAQGGEAFGSALAAASFGRSALADLAVGAPRHVVLGGQIAGAVAVLYGHFDGLAPLGNQLWTQGSGGIAGKPEDGDRFGDALA